MDVANGDTAFRRVLQFAATIPASSSAASVQKALQTLIEGGPGLKWVAGNAITFANRNVVNPLLKVASTASSTIMPGMAGYSNSNQRAADPDTCAGRLSFDQSSKRRRAGRLVLNDSTLTSQHRSRATARRAAPAAAPRTYVEAHATLSSPSAGLYCLALDSTHIGEEEALQYESLDLMQRGLQCSML